MPRRRSHTRMPKRSENSGFGSGLEKKNHDLLVKLGANFEYESEACKFYYTKPVHKGKCNDCQSSNVGSNHTYTSDFKIITQSGKEIWVEAKGGGYCWTGETRAKHILLSKQFPEREIRFVFTDAQALIKQGSKTTNKQWCARYGFKCASRLIPKAWLEE